MAEEFQESDIIFCDHFTTTQHNSNWPARNCSHKYSKKTKKKKMEKNSLPVKIQESVFQCRDNKSRDHRELEKEDEEMEPPHVIIGRRVAGKMEFSVCTGIGRTLKGRDLSQVRNSILRLTGYLET